MSNLIHRTNDVMKIRPVILGMMICLNLVLSAQDYSFKLDSLFDCEEIIVKDTIVFHDSDSSKRALCRCWSDENKKSEPAN